MAWRTEEVDELCNPSLLPNDTEKALGKVFSKSVLTWDTINCMYDLLNRATQWSGQTVFDHDTHTVHGQQWSRPGHGRSGSSDTTVTFPTKRAIHPVERVLRAHRHDNDDFNDQWGQRIPQINPPVTENSAQLALRLLDYSTVDCLRCMDQREDRVVREVVAGIKLHELSALLVSHSNRSERQIQEQLWPTYMFLFMTSALERKDKSASSSTGSTSRKQSTAPMTPGATFGPPTATTISGLVLGPSSTGYGSIPAEFQSQGPPAAPEQVKSKADLKGEFGWMADFWTSEQLGRCVGPGLDGLWFKLNAAFLISELTMDAGRIQALLLQPDIDPIISIRFMVMSCILNPHVSGLYLAKIKLPVGPDEREKHRLLTCPFNEADERNRAKAEGGTNIFTRARGRTGSQPAPNTPSGDGSMPAQPSSSSAPVSNTRTSVLATSSTLTPFEKALVAELRWWINPASRRSEYAIFFQLVWAAWLNDVELPSTVPKLLNKSVTDSVIAREIPAHLLAESNPGGPVKPAKAGATLITSINKIKQRISWVQIDNVWLPILRPPEKSKMEPITWTLGRTKDSKKTGQTVTRAQIKRPQQQQRPTPQLSQGAFTNPRPVPAPQPAVSTNTTANRTKQKDSSSTGIFSRLRMGKTKTAVQPAQPAQHPQWTTVPIADQPPMLPALSFDRSSRPGSDGSSRRSSAPSLQTGVHREQLQQRPQSQQQQRPQFQQQQYQQPQRQPQQQQYPQLQQRQPQPQQEQQYHLTLQQQQQQQLRQQQQQQLRQQQQRQPPNSSPGQESSGAAANMLRTVLRGKRPSGR